MFPAFSPPVAFATALTVVTIPMHWLSSPALPFNGFSGLVFTTCTRWFILLSLCGKVKY